MRRILLSFIILFSSNNLFSQNFDFDPGPFIFNDFFASQTAENEIKVMTYNVENLFNWVSDSGSDFEFIPADDPDCRSNGRCQNINWTQDKTQFKVSQIFKAIERQGSLPEVLIIQEIEGTHKDIGTSPITGEGFFPHPDSVIHMLKDWLGYDDFVFQDSPDVRGIDVVIFYKTDKLTLLPNDTGHIDASARIKERVPSTNPATRDVIRAKFLINNTPEPMFFEVFGNHWPAQNSRPEKRRNEQRIALAEVIQDEIDFQIFQHGKNYHAIVAGDFNTLPSENPNPLDHILTNNGEGEPGNVFWENSLIDTEVMFREFFPDLAMELPESSYYFRGFHVWNKFDRILVSDSLMDGIGLEADIDTFRIIAPDFLLEFDYMNCRSNGSRCEGPFRGPATFRYNHATDDPNKAGFSDHLPVSIILSW